MLSLCAAKGANGQAPDPPVCNRTQQVQNEIVAETGIACGQVTATQLETITVLGLSFKSIARLRLGDFNGLANLETLALHNNQLHSLPAGIFDGLTMLEQISLYNNQWQSLDEDIFDGLINLEVLSISTQLQALPEDIFTGLTNLEFLDMRDNQLRTLPADIFDGLTMLEEIYLTNNQLQTLPADVFDGLANLGILWLHNNQLQSLPADIFDGLTNLEVLTLAINPFSDGLPSAVIERLKSVANVALDLVAVNNVLPATLRLPIDDPPKELDLEEAFVRSRQGTFSPAESYEITVADETMATATQTASHTLMIDALAEGKTEITVAGIYGDQRATQRFTVIAEPEPAANLIFRIKVFLEGAQ